MPQTADDFSPDAMGEILALWNQAKVENRKVMETRRKEVAHLYGQHVKVERCRRVLSQEALARLTKRSISFIAKVECGNELPSKSLHQALMRVFLSKPEADPSKLRIRGIHEGR